LSAPLTYDANGARFAFLLRLNNYGHSPRPRRIYFF
jgi:hypothetical protein